MLKISRPLLAAGALLAALCLPPSGNTLAAPRYAELKEVAEPAPPLAERPGGPDLLPAHRGKPVLINFWATWCAPCREEMVAIDDLRRTRPGLVVLTVAVADTRSTVKAFLDENLLDQLPVIHDPESLQSRTWQARVLPTTVLLDADGQIRYRATGALDWQERSVSAVLDGLTRTRRVP